MPRSRSKSNLYYQGGAWAARMILSLTLLLSGVTKAIDPKGTVYKLQDYLIYFDVPSLLSQDMLTAIAVMLCSVEFLLGIYLFFGIRRRFTSYLTLIFIGLMTLVTLFILIWHPVSDCGCFGDAIHLTNGQTFVKNLVLLGCAIVYRYTYATTHKLIGVSLHWLVSMYSILFILFVSLYNNYYLPLADFRPYKVGVNIPKAMLIPEGAAEPEYETTFWLEKNGRRQRFTIDNYPDSTWTYISTEKKLVKEGYVPPITDFSVCDTLGNDLTDSLLADTGYTMMLISPTFDQANRVPVDEINALNDYCLDHKYRFYALTASSMSSVDKWIYYTGAEYPIYFCDATVLKTMVRSNPGLILLHGGTILGKWSGHDLPTLSDGQSVKSIIQDGDNNLRILLKIILYYLIPLLFITFANKFWMNHKHHLNHKTMRQKIVAGNWKMNMNLQDGINLAKEINETLKADKPNCGVVICTPFIHLASVAPLLDKSLVKLGAENCADKAKGAYTGEVSAEMVKSTGADYVILGHSERRQYYHETPEILKEKVQLALQNGLKIIFCIGETLEEREANKQNEVVKAELDGSVYGLSAEEWKNIVLAYEPIWAIGTGKTATADQAEEMLAYIRSTVAEKYGKAVAEETTILYGGSCKPSNAKELFAKPDIDGGLIGGASLKAADFKGIIDAWK